MSRRETLGRLGFPGCLLGTRSHRAEALTRSELWHWKGSASRPQSWWGFCVFFPGLFAAIRRHHCAHHLAITNMHGREKVDIRTL